jgi:hypothetical protein
MSQAYVKKKDYQSAIFYGEKSLAISRSINQKDKIKDAAENLAEANAYLNNFQKAYEFEKINSNIKDSLYSDDRQKTISEMQTKYDVDKKEKENQLLNQKVELQEMDSKQQRIITYTIEIVAFLIFLLAFFVFRGYRQKQKINFHLAKQNTKIKFQKEVIEEKNKNITDSITYARRIQSAILPSLESMRTHLPELFVLYKPKDIVSGDFYWFTEKKGYLFLAVADCTGHGVPGAFMSMIGNDLLNQIVIEKEILEPSEILSLLHEGIRNSLKQDDSDKQAKDGMDIAIVRMKKNVADTELYYAGALRPLWIMKQSAVVIETPQKELLEYKPDKYSVGGSYSSDKRQFTDQSIK